MIPEGTVIRPGDELIRDGSNHGRGSEIVKVDRVTPTGIIALVGRFGGERYNPNGTQRGGDKYYRSTLSLATPEARKEIERQSKRQANMRVVQNVNLSRLSDDKLARIAAILNEKEGN